MYILREYPSDILLQNKRADYLRLTALYYVGYCSLDAAELIGIDETRLYPVLVECIANGTCRYEDVLSGDILKLSFIRRHETEAFGVSGENAGEKTLMRALRSFMLIYFYIFNRFLRMLSFHISSIRY